MWVAGDDCVSCGCVWRSLSTGKLTMMMMMLTLSTMVVGLVWVVWVDPGSEVVVEREGNRKGSAEGWMASSTQ